MVSSKPAARADFASLDDHLAEGVQDGFKEPSGDSDDEPGDDSDEFIATAATIGVVGVGVVLFEAALLPGLVLGVAATLAPKYLPKLGGALNPLFKSTVRGAYKFGKKAREMAAEVQEQVHDIAAEVKAEDAKVGAGGERDRSTGARAV